MKRIITFIAAVFAFANLSAQSIEIHGYNTVLNNSTVQLWSDSTNVDLSAEFHVKLIAGTNRKIMAKRRVVSLVPNTNTLFCWTACYGPNVNVSLGAFTMSAGDENIFSSHYFHNNIVGTTTIAYTFYDSTNVADSATFTIVKHLTLSGGKEIVSNFPTISDAYPNPANGVVNFTITNLQTETVNYSIVNSTGQVIEKNTVTDEQLKLNTENLAEGIYYFIAYQNTSVICTKKFIVKR